MFSNRAEAGRALAAQVSALGWHEPPLVLAISPEAVPIAFEVAHALHAELDVMEVRPFFARGRGDRELGLVASGGVRVVHANAQGELHLSDEAVAEAAGRVAADIQAREHQWRRRHPRENLGGHTIVLVGQAGDSRLDGAVLVARALGAARVVAAVPSALPGSLDQARAEADAVVCPHEVEEPATFGAPPSEAEVRTLLERAEEWRAPVPV